MDNNKTFRERTLKRIHSDERSTDSQKKRKLSRVFLLIDAIIIILILLFFYDGKDQEELYFSSKIDYKNTQIRFSITIDKESENYLMSLSFKSKSDEGIFFKFKKSIAKISIYHEEQLIDEKIIGPGIEDLTLIHGKSKTFVESVEFTKINKFISENSNKFKMKKKSLLQFKQSKFKFNAKMSLNIKENLTSTINFYHEVK